MNDTPTKEYYKVIGKAIYDETQRVPDHDEDFDYEDELSVIARDYPDRFEKRKNELIEEKSLQFEEALYKRDELIHDLSHMTPELIETTKQKINNLDLSLIKIIEWFTTWDVNKNEEMRSFISFQAGSVQDESGQSSIIKTKKMEPRIAKSDAIKLLEKLENPEYIIAEDDRKYFNTKNFKVYRSQYINSRNNQFYKDAFDVLIKKGQLMHDDFLRITKCPSKWYKNIYIQSFTYHCENNRGKFFERCKQKEFKYDSQKRIDGSIKPVLAFTIR